MLEFKRAIEILKDNGIDSRSSYPFVYKDGRKIGLAYTFDNVLYGNLERYKIFEDEESFDLFVKQIKWYKEHGKEKNVYLEIDNYSVESPNYSFLHNGEEISYENMINIDEFDENVKKELEGSDLKRITYEIERLFKYYTRVKNFIDEYMDSINKSLSDLFESYKLLQKRIDVYNNLNIERNIEEICFNKVSIEIDVKKENELKDTFNQYKVGDNPYEDYVDLLKRVWSLCMELEVDDDYIVAMKTKNDVMGEQRIIDLKLEFLEKAINKKGLFKGIKNIAKRFKKIEKKNKTMELDEDYGLKYKNNVIAKYSLFETINIYNAYSYLDSTFNISCNYEEVAANYKERKELNINSNLIDNKRVKEELRSLYNNLNIDERDKLVLLNSEYYDLFNLLINIDDYKIKTGEELVNILSVNNEFNKAMERCFNLASEIVPFNQDEDVRRIFSYLNFYSQEDFLISLVKILNDLENITLKMVNSLKFRGYFKTFNSDNFKDKLIKISLNVNDVLCDIDNKDLRYVVANVNEKNLICYSYLTLNIPRNGETEINIVNDDKVSVYMLNKDIFMEKEEEVVKVVNYQGEIVRDAAYNYVEKLKKILEYNFVNWDIKRKL